MLATVTDSLVPAVFGVIGVAVGAMLTGVVDWARQRSKDDRRARAAARLLRTDLFLVARILKIALMRSELPGFVDISLPSWTTYRDVLAAALDDGAWIAVSAGCARTQALADFVLRLDKPNDRGRLKPKDAMRLESMVDDVVRAHDALSVLAEDDRPYEALLEVDPLPPISPQRWTLTALLTAARSEKDEKAALPLSAEIARK